MCVCACVCVCMSAQLVQRMIFCGGVLGDIIFSRRENGHLKPAFTNATYFGKTIITDALKICIFPRPKGQVLLMLKDDFVTLV